MENVIDVKEHLKDRKWNEDIRNFISSCESDDPIDILILLESYLVGKRNIDGEF